ALDSILASPRAALNMVSPDRYPTPGGDATRTAMPLSAAAPSSRIATIPLPAPCGPNDAQFIQKYDALRTKNAPTGIIPAIDKGELFFQDGLHVWAVHLESGMPLAGWLQNYPTRNGQFDLGISPISGAPGATQAAMRQRTLTVTEDSVLAVMGLADNRTTVQT